MPPGEASKRAATLDVGTRSMPIEAGTARLGSGFVQNDWTEYIYMYRERERVIVLRTSVHKLHDFSFSMTQFPIASLSPSVKVGLK